jgi:hypothetical protein
MSGGWTGQERILNGTAQAVLSSKTNQVFSFPFSISNGGAMEGLRIDIKTASVTVTNDIVFTLQHLVNGTWTTVKSDNTLVTAGTLVTIKLHENVPADYALLPLTDQARVVITTGVDDVATVSSIRVYQEL